LHAALPLVYQELRRLAHHYMRRERPDHTLQSTALVHEAYLRLEKQGPAPFRDRAHFVAICAQLMRRGGCELTLDDTVVFESRNLDLVALDDALAELAKLNPQQSQIVELRFFGGLSIEESAQVLGLSAATVQRKWSTARIWLHHQLSRAES